MGKAGSLLLLATILAAPAAGHDSRDRGGRDSRDRGGHEHDGRCGHEQPGSGGGHGRHRRVCGAISVSSAQRQWAREPFSATRTLDLQFRMRVRSDDEDPHVVTFRVLTPKGYVYQQIQVPHRAQEADRVSRVSASIPVAGTFIATSSLYGRWRVVPYLDDDPEPCAAASGFRIVQ